MLPRTACVEVHVIGVPEGGYGVFGRVVGESALLEMISEAKTGTPAADDPGVRIDPVCGMAASDMVTTLEHEGTTYGFCSPGCRRHFADKLAREASRWHWRYARGAGTAGHSASVPRRRTRPVARRSRRVVAPQLVEKRVRRRKLAWPGLASRQAKSDRHLTASDTGQANRIIRGLSRRGCFRRFIRILRHARGPG